jgi:hypothetical protein
MKKIHWMILAGMAALGSMVSCKHELYDPNNTGGSGNTGGTTGVCFESEILPIFQSSCAKSGCHDAASAEDGYVLDSYANIMKKGIVPGNPSQSKIYEVIMDTDPDDRMPEPPNAPLSKAQTDKIYQWIKEGAKNTTGCNTSCDTTVFTYSAGVKPIMDTYCVGCHSATLMNGNIRLDNHASVMAAAKSGKLMGSIQHQTGYVAMPQGGAKLSDCSITVIRKWIQAGYPNN